MRWRSLISVLLIFVLVAGDASRLLPVLRHSNFSSFLAPTSKTLDPAELAEFRRLSELLQSQKLGTNSKALLQLFPDLDKKIKRYSQFLKEEKSLQLLLLLEEELKDLDSAMKEEAAAALDQLFDEMGALFEQHGGELQQLLGECVAQFHTEYRETFGKKYPVTLRDLTWWAKFIRKQSPQMGLGKAVVIGAKYIYSKRLKTKEDQDQFWSLLQKLQADAKFTALFAGIDLASLRELPKGESSIAAEAISSEMTFKKYLELNFAGIEKVEGISAEYWQWLLEGIGADDGEKIFPALLAVYLLGKKGGCEELAQKAIAEAARVGESIDSLTFYKQDAYEAIKMAQVAAGEKRYRNLSFTEALNVLESYEEKSEKRFRMLIHLAKQVAKGDKEGARKLIAEAVTFAESIDTSESMLRSLAFSDIAEAKAVTEDFSEALEMVERISEPYYKSDALRAIALALAVAGEKEKANQIFNRAVDVAEWITHLENKILALRRIAAALAVAGEKEKAKQIFAKAVTVAELFEESKSFDKSDAFCEIAVALAVAGEKKEAKQLLAKAVDLMASTDDPSYNQFFKNHSLNKIAKAKIEVAETGLLAELEQAEVSGALDTLVRRNLAKIEAQAKQGVRGSYQAAVRDEGDVLVVGHAHVGKNKKLRAEWEEAQADEKSKEKFLKDHPYFTPPNSRTLVMSKTTVEILEQVGFAAMSGEPLMLIGPTGVGKSAGVKWLAAATFHEHLCVGVTPAVTKEDLIGGWRPSQKKGQIVEWQEGPLLHAVRTGKWITLEEFNLAPTEVIEMLNFLLVHRKLAYVNERGEMKYQAAHPEFRIFVTQNPGSYNQRQRQSEPLLARFVKMEVGELSREELGEIVGATSGLSGTVISTIVEIHDEIDKQSKPRTAKDQQVYGKGEKEKYEFDLRTLTRVAQRIKEELEKEGTNETLVVARAFWSEYGSVLRSEADRAAFFTLLDVQLQLQAKKISRVDLEPSEVKITSEIAAPPSEARNDNLVFTATYKNGDTHKVTLAIGAEAEENLPFVGDEGLIPESTGTRKELFRIAEALSRGEDLLLVGNTGAGKTSRIQYLMMRLGKPFWYKNLDSDTAIEELIGEDYPAGLDKDGRPKFERRDGILIRAMERGEPIFLDELNLSALPEWLTTVLDERKLILPGRVVTAMQGFQVIGAMNPPRVEGRHVLSPAMKSRFREIWMQEPRDEKELSEIAYSYFNGVGEKIFKGAASWWQVLMRASLKSGLGLGELQQRAKSAARLQPELKTQWEKGLTSFFKSGIKFQMFRSPLFNAIRASDTLFYALDPEEPSEETPRKKAIHEMSLDELFNEISKHDPRFQDPRFRAHIREQVEIKQRQVETIGTMMGGDHSVKFRPGPGWAYDFDANAILYPLYELLEKEADELIGVSFHEGSHRDISRLDIEEAIFGFFFSNETLRLLLNAVEDPRVNNWAEMKYPGATPYLKKLYDQEFPEEIKEKQEVMRQLAAEVGMKTEDGEMKVLPHMEYALSIIYFWARIKDQQRQAAEEKENFNLEAAVQTAKEKTLTKFATHEPVKQAIEKTYPSFAPLFQNYLPPNPYHEDGRRNLPGEAKKWELAIGLAEAVKKELLPEYQKLVDLSKEQIKQMIRDGKLKSSQGGQGGKGRPIDPSLLDEEARKMLEENSRKAADKFDGKMDYPKRDGAKERARRAREAKEGKEAKPKPAPSDESFLAKRLREQREREERSKDLETTHSRYYAPVARLIEDLAGRLGNLFWPNSRPRNVGHFFTGKKLDIGKVAQSEMHGWSSLDDWKLFMRRKIPVKRDYKFTIVIDQSGSMAGAKGEKAINATLLFMHVLSHLGIEFNVIGFSDGVSFHRENFSSEFAQDPGMQEELTRAIDRSMGSGMTNDGAAMREAVEKMKDQPGERRVIIVLTDGEGNGEPLEPELAKAKAAGLEVIGIGIGDGLSYVAKSYKKHVLVRDLDQLPDAFARILEYELELGGALADEVELRRNRFVGMPSAQLAPLSLWLASRLVDPYLGLVAGSFALSYYAYHLIQGSLNLWIKQKMARLKARKLSPTRQREPLFLRPSQSLETAL